MYSNIVIFACYFNQAQYVSLPPVLTLCLYLLLLKPVRINTDCWIFSVFRGDLFVGVAAASSSNTRLQVFLLIHYANRRKIHVRYICV